MASFEGSIGIPDGGFNLKVEYSITQNTSENYSVVSATGYVKRNNSAYYPYNSQSSSSLTIDGSSATYSGSYNLGSDGYKEIVSHSKRIYHNADGTKSINISFSFDGLLSNWYPKGNISQTITLPTIPRYANITSFSVSQRNETSVIFNWSVDAGCDWAWYSVDGGSNWYNLPNNNIVSGLSAGTTYNFKLKVRRTDSQLTTDSGTYTQSTYDYPKPISINNFAIGDGATVNLYNPLNRNVILQLISNNDSSIIGTYSGTYSGNINTEFKTAEAINSQYASIPNSNSGTYYAKVTYGNIVKTLGTGTYTTKPSECSPTFENFNFEDVNTITLALTGNDQNIVPGYSNIKVLIPTEYKATANKSATMSKYTFTCGNAQTDISYSDSESVNGTINNVANGTFNVYAVDSRTNSTVVTKLANQVINYNNLIKRNINVARNNGVSETTTLTLNGIVNLVNFGIVTNSIQEAKYRYKATDSNTWSNYTNITLTVDNNGNFSFNGNIQGDTNDGFDIANSYNIEVVVSDELSTITFTANLNSGVPNIALHKNGVSIMGKYDTSVGGLFQIEGKDIFKLSSSEFFTGYKWIDGKKIYGKVLSGTVGTPITHNITDVNMFFEPRGFYVGSSGNTFPLPSVRPNYPDYACGIYTTATQILFDKGNSIPSATCYILQLYTKTTD